MSHTSHMEALFAALRDVERSARARLIAGCAEDNARIERFLERPVAVARREAHDAMAGIGAIPDTDLAANLRREAFERIGITFAETVCSNVGLRARARFKMYANDLAGAEVIIAQALAETHLVPAKRLLPRMFAIGRLDIDEMRIPDPPRLPSEIDDWVEALRTGIRFEIQELVIAARDRVLTHGFDRLGIVKTRIDLALVGAS